MKKIKLIVFLLALPGILFAQNVANRVLEYKPAPGQHINVENIGTPQAAQNMPNELNNLVSLGSFGGFIVLGFEEACANDPKNPYGIDFTVFGNAFQGSSEPGIIWVMKDDNKNGEPDDTWYEIKGSQHFQSETRNNYVVTYYKTQTRNILWTDNSGHSGILKANSFNTQEYYPSAEYFPFYPQNSVSFEGTFLSSQIDSSNKQQFVVLPYDFGYADNRARKQSVELMLPDNPYTAEIEGAGGDPIDISWAVDSEGKDVILDSIHFIKIVTGNLASVGWLGEISTDVAYVVDVEANSAISGENKLLVIYPFNLKIQIGNSLQLEAAFFENGKRKEMGINFTPENTEIIEADLSGLITAKKIGQTEILVTSEGMSKSALIHVIQPDSIEILSDFTSVYVRDSILLEAQVFDNEGDLMETEIQFDIETPGLGEIITKNGNQYFVAQNSGKVSLNFQVEGFIEKQVQFQIFTENDLIEVYFSMKTETENLLPLQKIRVELSSLNSFVENRQNDYSGLNRHTLAHTLLAGLQKKGVIFKFRDDVNSNGNLYLYSVENNGDFIYGWGGKTEPAAFAKAWIVCKNGQHLLNNFNEFEIAENDTIILYHVSDIKNPWTYSKMISDKDSAEINDEIVVKLEQTTCTLLNGNITVSEFEPIVNQEITGEQIYFSNGFGEARILIQSQPPFVISSGNNAILISKKIITGITGFSKLNLKIYPNPAEKQLFVKTNFAKKVQMYIYDLTGKCIESKSMSDSIYILDIQEYKSGIYFLKIVNTTTSETFKFIKK